DQQIRSWADRPPHRGGAGDPEPRELLNAGAVTEVARHFVERRELHRVEAGFHGFLSHAREAVGRTRLSRPVDIGIVADTRLDAAAKQVVRRNGVDFAANVPQTLFQGARGYRGRRAAARDLRLHRTAEPLDIINASAFQQVEELLHPAQGGAVL